MGQTTEGLGLLIHPTSLAMRTQKYAERFRMNASLDRIQAQGRAVIRVETVQSLLEGQQHAWVLTVRILGTQDEEFQVIIAGNEPTPPLSLESYEVGTDTKDNCRPIVCLPLQVCDAYGTRNHLPRDCDMGNGLSPMGTLPELCALPPILPVTPAAQVPEKLCYNCGSPGHLQRDCSMPHQTKAQRRRGVEDHGGRMLQDMGKGPENIPLLPRRINFFDSPFFKDGCEPRSHRLPSSDGGEPWPEPKHPSVTGHGMELHWAGTRFRGPHDTRQAGPSEWNDLPLLAPPPVTPQGNKTGRLTGTHADSYEATPTNAPLRQGRPMRILRHEEASIDSAATSEDGIPWRRKPAHASPPGSVNELQRLVPEQGPEMPSLISHALRRDGTPITSGQRPGWDHGPRRSGSDYPPDFGTRRWYGASVYKGPRPGSDWHCHRVTRALLTWLVRQVGSALAQVELELVMGDQLPPRGASSQLQDTLSRAMRMRRQHDLLADWIELHKAAACGGVVTIGHFTSTFQERWLTASMARAAAADANVRPPAPLLGCQLRRQEGVAAGVPPTNRSRRVGGLPIGWGAASPDPMHAAIITPRPMARPRQVCNRVQWEGPPPSMCISRGVGPYGTDCDGRLGNLEPVYIYGEGFYTESTYIGLIKGHEQRTVDCLIITGLSDGSEKMHVSTGGDIDWEGMIEEVYTERDQCHAGHPILAGVHVVADITPEDVIALAARPRLPTPSFTFRLQPKSHPTPGTCDMLLSMSSNLIRTGVECPDLIVGINGKGFRWGRAAWRKGTCRI